MPRHFFIFFGPPGSGKGTQSDMLAESLGLPVISPGELLRHEEEAGSELGRRIAPLIDAGQMVPDELVEEMVKNRLARPDAERGALLDGFPRSFEQADFFEHLSGSGSITHAISIRVPDDIVIARIGGRRVCDCGASYHNELNPPKKAGVCDNCGRELEVRHDDRPEVLKKRLETYHASIEPLASRWKERGRLLEIDGTLTVGEVHEKILGYALEAMKEDGRL